ncbi:hypothetical protein LCL95_01110 [Bacillus timonensis]|nr:hypothetical protein [Bacillus timonensis]
MLSFEEKLSIIESFPQLERHNVSLGRVNFHFPDSLYEKKIVVYHLHPNGNGFVFAGYLDDQEVDAKGMVNIREYSESELRGLIQASIDSLSRDDEEEDEHAFIADPQKETWANAEKVKLVLVLEDEWWNVYDGLNLDATFGSYQEAIEYLREEGFMKR